jgi:hypothetical protein
MEILYLYPIKVNDIKQGDYANELCIDISAITYSGIFTPVSETPDCSVMTITIPPEELQIEYLGYITNRQGSSLTTSALDGYYYNDTVSSETVSVTLPIVVNFKNELNESIPAGTPITYKTSFNDQFLYNNTDIVASTTVIKNASGYITCNIVIPLSLFRSGQKANSLCIEFTGITLNQTFKSLTTAPLCAGFTSNIIIDNGSNIGIDNLREANIAFSLSQNIPYPANSTTRIDYTIPEAGEVIFHVHSINGQLLYSKTIEAPRGNQSIELNTTTLSAGVYFYSMEYKGQRIVKRMSVK